MVNGAFFCATLRSFRKGHTTFVQAGAETSETGAGVVKPVPGFSRQSHSGRMGANLGDGSTDFRVVFQLLCFPSVIGQERRTSVVVVR